MKKRNYRKAIITGFVTMYVLSMFFATEVLKDSYEERHANQGEELARDVASALSAANIATIDKKQLNYLMTHPFLGPSEFKYTQYSVAIYDESTKEKIAQTSLLMTDSYPYHLDMGREEINVYPIAQFMTEDEKEKLVQIELETRKAEENRDYPLYFYNFFVNKETNEPLAFDMFKINWDQTADGGEYDPIYSKWGDINPEWRWYHPDVEFTLYELPSTIEPGVTEKVYRPNEEYEEMSEKSYMSQKFANYDLGIMVPYLKDGYDSWKRWQKDVHMQNFPDSLVEEFPTTEKYEMFTPRKITSLIRGNGYYMIFRQTSNPWLAAADYMKYVYLVGFILMLACMLKVLYTTEKTYRERAKLEETRRDFTNAIAHELKTPLGVIRGFAENLEENTNEEKREYYLKQIVGQTERMDEMVKEMIYISKLDSDKFVLDKKEVSFKKLIDEALESLSIYIEEKHLQVSYKGLSDRVIEGDPQYLKKAIWNLVSNAVEYNRQNGQVEIIFEESALKIRNTGNQIPEEDLPHVFDMFYTGNKSRTSGESHLGLGLYLAKKIFDLHGLHASIGNIEDGVEVVIKK